MSNTIERFTLAERRWHWLNALAVLFLGTTGVLIWRHLDELKFHHLNVISEGHVFLGGGVLVLSALAFAFFRRRRVERAAKRFNPGQRFNLLAFQVLLGFMVASGLVVRFGKPFGLTKALHHQLLNLHLYSAAAIGVLVLGHLGMVFVVPKNRGILAAMLTGRVGRDVVARSAPQWLPAETAAERVGQQAG